jgi:hypothetical protein
MSKKDWSKIPSAKDVGYEPKEREEDADKIKNREKKIAEFSAACDDFYNDIIAYAAEVAGGLSSDTPTVRVSGLEKALTENETYKDTKYHVDELMYGLKHHEKTFKAKEEKSSDTFTHWTMRRPFPEGVENPFIRAQTSIKDKKSLYLVDCSDPQKGKQVIITLSVVYPKPRGRTFHGLNKMPGDPEPPMILPNRFNHPAKSFPPKGKAPKSASKDSKETKKKPQNDEDDDDDDFKPKPKKAVAKKSTKDEPVVKKSTKDEPVTKSKKKANLDDDEDEKPVKKSSKSK